jgi:hypothetical protein
VGANCRVKEHDAPLFRAAEDTNGTPLHTELAREYPAPLTEKPVTVKGNPPVLVTVRVWVAMLSTWTDPKLIGPMFE